MVEARVRQLQAECILPVDPAPNRIRRLTVGERFRELEHRRERQTPGRLSWLAAPRKQRRKLLIPIHAAQRIGDAKAGTPFRKRRQSHTARLVRNTEVILRFEGHG